MKITPLDIQQQQFRSKFRGFDVREVELFLDTVASQFEELTKENYLLNEELANKEAKISQFQENEKILKETMISAQKVAEDIKSNAQKEVELIISNAEFQAEKILNSAHGKFTGILNDISELKKIKIRFASSLKSMIDSHLTLLNMEEEGQSLKELEDKVLSLKGVGS